MSINANAAINPFSLMMEPEIVLRAMECSEQLRALRRHKLRPLDKPLIPYTREDLARRAVHEANSDYIDPDDELLDKPAK